MNTMKSNLHEKEETAFPTVSMQSMTMYDYFAAAAIQGLLASDGDSHVTEDQEAMAERAYEYAEAMMFEREYRMSEVFAAMVLRKIKHMKEAKK